jgi:hypothetical protein
MESVRERLATPARGRVKPWPAFNLFRHKQKSHLVCAVPEDHPVPSFIEGSTWEFAGTVSEPTPVPLGFSRKAADAGVRFSGFYLFQASPIAPARITLERRREQPRAGAPPWMPHPVSLSEVTERGLGRPETRPGL